MARPKAAIRQGACVTTAPEEEMQAGRARFGLSGLVLQLRRARPQVWNHSIRVAALMRRLDAELARPFPARITKISGLLHDIGKITVPPGLLEKGRVLTEVERSTVEQHARAGAEMLGPLATVPEEAAMAAIGHHERWDGSGYPYGQKARQIPRIARLCAVADVFDAITAEDRRYRRPLPIAKAVAEIAAGSGILYDPEMAAALTAIAPDDLQRTVALPASRTITGEVLEMLERDSA